MAGLDHQEVYLVKKALAIAILALEQTPEIKRLTDDVPGMKRLLGEVVGSPGEMARLQRYARIALTGSPD